MRYKFTQLKDLPNSKAGSVYYCDEIGTDFWRSINDKPVESYRIVVGDTIERVVIGKTVLDNPEWFKREVDEDGTHDFTCPHCGRHNLYITKRLWKNDNPECSDYGLHCCIYLECPCGKYYEEIKNVEKISRYEHMCKKEAYENRK